MRFDRFEIAALQLASRGVTLTVANVAAHLEMPLAQAEAHLDRMARDGRLEVEVDERLGVVRYRPLGLDCAPPSMPFKPTAMVSSSSRGLAPPRPAEKNAVLGALIALLIPGFGLFYAAPLSVAAVAGMIVIVLGEAVKGLPVIGGALGTVAYFAFAVASAALAVPYARQYNRYGARTHLERLPVLSV
jgi:hypothetical protein